MNKDVEKWVELFRDADDSKLSIIEEDLLRRRIKWFEENIQLISRLRGDDLLKAYRLLLLKIGIDEIEAEVVFKDRRKIVFHSKNFCPSLEACKILGLNTRIVCRAVFESPADALIKRLNPILKFSRNYDRIRPYAPYCEEIISLIN